MSLARKKFTEFKERSDEIPDAELDDFWASAASRRRSRTCSASGRAASSTPATG